MATFGKTDKGADERNGFSGDIRGLKTACPVLADISSLTFYVKDALVGGNAIGLVYDAAYGLLGSTNETPIADDYDGWKQLDFAAPLRVSPQAVWLCFFVDFNCNFYRDADSASYCWDTVVYPNIPDPLVPEGTGDFELSIYATYTPVIGGGGGLAKTQLVLTL